jgi:hypothetical protein
MGFECEDDRRNALSSRCGPGGLKEDGVAAMDAIEIPDSIDGADEIGRNLIEPMGQQGLYGGAGVRGHGNSVGGQRRRKLTLRPVMVKGCKTTMSAGR